MRTLPSMKLAFRTLGLAAMLVAPYGMAQAPGLNGGQVTLLRPQLGATATGCPVLLSASQRSSPKQFETGSLVPARPAQGLTITISGVRALRITSAEVVAHALPPRNRTVLASTLESEEVTRPFHLATKDGGSFSSNLWMEDVTSIRWVEVKSITYSNGTFWQESETQKCSVRPDPYVLISSAR